MPFPNRSSSAASLADGSFGVAEQRGRFEVVEDEEPTRCDDAPCMASEVYYEQGPTRTHHDPCYSTRVPGQVTWYCNPIAIQYSCECRIRGSSLSD